MFVYCSTRWKFEIEFRDLKIRNHFQAAQKHGTPLNNSAHAAQNSIASEEIEYNLEQQFNIKLQSITSCSHWTVTKELDPKDKNSVRIGHGNTANSACLSPLPLARGSCSSAEEIPPAATNAQETQRQCNWLLQPRHPTAPERAQRGAQASRAGTATKGQTTVRGPCLARLSKPSPNERWICLSFETRHRSPFGLVPQHFSVFLP